MFLTCVMKEEKCPFVVADAGSVNSPCVLSGFLLVCVSLSLCYLKKRRVRRLPGEDLELFRRQDTETTSVE